MYSIFVIELYTVMFRLILLFLFVFSGWNLMAQPPNDDCINATFLPDVTNWCSAIGEYTNVGATVSGYGSPTCGSGGLNDVWFTFVAQATDITIIINGNSGPGGGGTLLNPRVVLYAGTCGGTIGASWTRNGTRRVRGYGCIRHKERGRAVCPVGVHQPMEEVEGALLDYVQEHVLTPDTLETVVRTIRGQIATQMPRADADVRGLEDELKVVRAEQKRLARAVAMADDVPELVTELQHRSARMRTLQAQIEAARRTPGEISALVDQVESAAVAKLQDLREALTQPAQLRQVLRTLFPDGLRLTPVQAGRRHIWRIQGAANLRELVGPWSRTCGDPKGT